MSSTPRSQPGFSASARSTSRVAAARIADVLEAGVQCGERHGEMRLRHVRVRLQPARRSACRSRPCPAPGPAVDSAAGMRRRAPRACAAACASAFSICDFSSPSATRRSCQRLSRPPTQSPASDARRPGRARSTAGPRRRRGRAGAPRGRSRWPARQRRVLRLARRFVIRARRERRFAALKRDVADQQPIHEVGRQRRDRLAGRSVAAPVAGDVLAGGSD